MRLYLSSYSPGGAADALTRLTRGGTCALWDGLNILPYSVAPHYRSDHHESAAIEETVQYF